MSGTGYDPSRGLPGPPGPAGSFEALNTTTQLRTLVASNPDAVVALNEPSRAGVFFWDTNPARDDGGTRFNVGGLGTVGPGWQRQWEGEGVINAAWFGFGEGLVDNSTVLQSMINALAMQSPEVSIGIPSGTFVLASPIVIPAGVTKFTVTGMLIDTAMAGDSPLPSVLYCNAITGYVFDPTAAYGPGADTLSSLTLQDIEIDGANGSLATIDYSNTLMGAVKPPASGKYIPNVSYRGTAVRHIVTQGAAAYNIQNAFTVELEKALAWDISNGYGVYWIGLAATMTTLTLRKCYLHGCAEVFYNGANCTDAHIHDTVFESSLVAIASYDTNLDLHGCYFENIGSTPPGGTGIPLTPIDMGLNDVQVAGVSIPINTAINIRHGSSHFLSCQFNGLNVGGNAVAWFRGVGKGQTFGAAGELWLTSCRAATLTNRSIASDTTPASRGSYCVNVDDATAFSARGAVAPPGMIILYADARLVTRGRIMLPIDPALNDWTPTLVRNGQFMVGLDFDSARFAAAPTVSPHLGQWNVGDRSLSASGMAVYTNVIAGSPGTWIGEEVGSFSGQTSKVLYNNLIVVGKTFFGANVSPISGIQNAMVSDLALDPTFPSSRMAAWLIGGSAGMSLFANYGADGARARAGFAGRWFHDVATGDWILYSSVTGTAGAAIALVEKLRIKADGSLQINTGSRLISGTGSPEAAVVGAIGDLFLSINGTENTVLWVKESGASTNTGWITRGSSVLTFGCNDITIVANTLALFPGYYHGAANGSIIAVPAPRTGTAKHLYVHQTPGTAVAGANLTYELYKNGVATGLKAVFDVTVAAGSDLTHTVAVAAGDLLDILVTLPNLLTSPGKIVASFEID